MPALSSGRHTLKPNEYLIRHRCRTRRGPPRLGGPPGNWCGAPARPRCRGRSRRARMLAGCGTTVGEIGAAQGGLGEIRRRVGRKRLAAFGGLARRGEASSAASVPTLVVGSVSMTTRGLRVTVDTGPEDRCQGGPRAHRRGAVAHLAGGEARGPGGCAPCSRGRSAGRSRGAGGTWDGAGWLARSCLLSPLPGAFYLHALDTAFAREGPVRRTVHWTTCWCSRRPTGGCGRRYGC